MSNREILELSEVIRESGLDWNAFIEEYQENGEDLHLSYDDFLAQCILESGYHKEQRQNAPPSNADRIRAMSDEDLTAFLHRCICEDGAPAFFRGLPECESDMDADSLIPLERCCQCLLYWLKSPYSANYWNMHKDNGKKEDNHE